MGLLDRMFAGLYDRMMAPSEVRGLADQRVALLADLDGTVVEIGAGTGLNLPHYPAAVERLLLCEPTREMRARLADRLAEAVPAPRTVEVSDAAAERLPLDDASVDHVVSTLVLCTVDDLRRTVAELARVVRPGGTIRILEHVAAEPGRTARVQRLVEPAWRVAARGCHLTREPRPHLDEAGFDVSGLEVTRIPGAASLSERAVTGVAVWTG